MSSARLMTPWFVDEQQSVNAATATFAAVTPESALGLSFTGKGVQWEWRLIGTTAAGNQAAYSAIGGVANISAAATVYPPASFGGLGLAALILSVPSIAASIVSSRIVVTPAVLGVAANTVNWVSWIRFIVH